MPLNLKSFRPIAHASIMRKAPAFSLRASRLSPTTLHPLNQRSLSNVQKKAPKAETIAQESVASRTRQRYRITPMSVRLAYQQRLKNVAATAYRDGETAGIRFGGHISRSKFILLFDRFFWPAFSGAVCALYICVSSNRFVKAMEEHAMKW